MSPHLIRLYLRTNYVVGRGPPIRIGRPAGLLRDAAVLTAANPFSRRRADGWNARMNRALAEAARRLHPVPAEGRLGDWREEGFLIEAPPARVAVLGRRFRQNALVVVRRGQAARLLLLK